MASSVDQYLEEVSTKFKSSKNMHKSCSLTIYVGRAVQVDAQDAPSGKRKYEDIIGDRGGYKVG
jgi:hypothetical protein